MRNTFPELQPLGNITCPILNAIKNRIPVTLAILGQTYHVSFPGEITDNNQKMTENNLFLGKMSHCESII